MIKTLESLEARTAKMSEDLTQIKIDIASNKEIMELKTKMAAVETKIWLILTISSLLLTGALGYFLKTN